MHQLERKILRLSTIVLFLSLLVVYALFYQVKWSQLLNKSESNNDKLTTRIYVQDGNDKKLVWALNESGIKQNSSWLVKNNILTGSVITWNSKPVTWNVQNKKDDIKISNEIKYLSWTQLFYGILESIEQLWIAYKYALEDKKWIYYIYLWDFKSDVASIARKLWWNIYTINTEQEILKNQLFGDKVTFINLPEYKNRIVLILIYIGKEAWLLQVDYKLYHKSKTYLQSLFID